MSPMKDRRVRGVTRTGIASGEISRSWSTNCVKLAPIDEGGRPVLPASLWPNWIVTKVALPLAVSWRTSCSARSQKPKEGRRESSA